MSASALILLWALTCGFGWLWWRYLKSGVIYSPGGTFSRDANPFNYLLAMVALDIAVCVLAVCAAWLTLLGLSKA